MAWQWIHSYRLLIVTAVAAGAHRCRHQQLDTRYGKKIATNNNITGKPINSPGCTDRKNRLIATGFRKKFAAKQESVAAIPQKQLFLSRPFDGSYPWRQ